MLIRYNIDKEKPYTTAFIAVCMIMMMFSDLCSNILPSFLGYCDELTFIFSAVLFILHIIEREFKIKAVYLVFFFTIILGLVGNLFSGVQGKVALIVKDVLMYSKPYVVFMCAYDILNQRDAKRLYRFLLILSKILIVILAICAALSSYAGLDMKTEKQFFCFFSKFPGTVAWWLILCFGIIYSNGGKIRLLYYLLSVFAIWKTGSGLGMFAMSVVALIYFFGEKQKKFRWWFLFVVIPIVLYIAKNEIDAYLINETAARFLLLYYAFVTAIRYFPLGAGFATYASQAAAVEYSLLYKEYGFQDIWGMTPESHPFLQDSYYSQLVGQLGFLGTFLAIVFIIYMVKCVFRIKERRILCSAFFVLLCWLVAGIGFGIASAWGCSLILSFVVLLKNTEKQNEKTNAEFKINT